jgi:hypothetical protein
MRKIILEALKLKIQSAVESALPQFKFYNKSNKGDEKGLIRYRWEVDGSLSFYIIFRPLSSEGFDVQIGWSTLNRCPSAHLLTPEILKNIFDYSCQEMVANIIYVAKKSGLAFWEFWKPSQELRNDPAAFGKAYSKYLMKSFSQEEALELVSNSVDEAVAEILEYGIPYLMSRVESSSK